MSNLLEDALAAVRQLPAERQDEIAQVMLDLAARDESAASDPAPVAQEAPVSEEASVPQVKPQKTTKRTDQSREKKARSELGLGIEGILQKIADDDERSPETRQEMREFLRDYRAGELPADDIDYVVALYRRLYGKPRKAQ